MGMAVIVRLMVRICRRNTIERVTILAPQVPRSLSLSRGNQVIDVFLWVMNSKKITFIKERVSFTTGRSYGILEIL